MVKHLILFLSILFFGCEMNSEQLIKSESINFENIKFNAVSKDLKFTNIQEGPEVETTKRLVKDWYNNNVKIDGFDGNLTANGETYDKDGISAAHKTLPLNSIVRVTNLNNGKSVKLKINDRGPYIKGRILDCSYGAAKELDFVQQGTTEVKVEVIKWGDNEYKK